MVIKLYVHQSMQSGMLWW